MQQGNGDLSDASDVFGFYVEKEYVGKRVKGSKVKVTWKFACLPDLKTNEVELKHSLVFGKREIKINGRLVFHKKKMFNGDFHHKFQAGGHLLKISIRDDFEGYVYDLSVNGVPFHRLTRISTENLEDMRKCKIDAEKRQHPEVKSMDFNDFIGDKKKATKSSNRTKSESSSSDDSSVGEDLWGKFEKSRSQPAPVSGWGGQSDTFGAPTMQASGQYYMDAPVHPTTSTGLSQITSGLDGLDFSSSSSTAHAPSTYNAQNPFQSPPRSTSDYTTPSSTSSNGFSFPSHGTGSPASDSSSQQQLLPSPVLQPQQSPHDFNTSPTSRLVNLNDITRPPVEPLRPTPAYSSTSTSYHAQGQPERRGLQQFNSDSITALYNKPPQPSAYSHAQPSYMHQTPSPYANAAPPPTSQHYGTAPQPTQERMKTFYSQPHYPPPGQPQPGQQSYNPFV